MAVQAQSQMQGAGVTTSFAQSLEGGRMAIPVQGPDGLLTKKVAHPLDQSPLLAVPSSVPASGQTLQTNNAPLKLSPEVQRRIAAAVLNSPTETTTASTPDAPASSGLRLIPR